MYPVSLIQSTPFDMHGRKLVAAIYSTSSRSTGRRIVIREGKATVFDSGDHYDIGNASNAADAWFDEQAKLAAMSMPELAQAIANHPL